MFVTPNMLFSLDATLDGGHSQSVRVYCLCDQTHAIGLKRVLRQLRILCLIMVNNDISEGPKNRMRIRDQVVIPKHDTVPPSR